MPDQKLTETLRAVAENEPTTSSELSDILNKSSSTAYRRISELEDKGWIEKRQTGRKKQIYLTEQGEEALEICPPGRQEREGRPQEDTTGAGEIRAHSYAVEFGIHEKSEDWSRQVVESSNLRFRQLEDGSEMIYHEDYTARVRPEHISIRVGEEIGSDAHQLADRLLEKAQEAKKDLESRIDLKLSYHPRNHRVRITEQEFAIVRHPFAEALIEDSDLGAEDVQFFAEDDNHELWIDDSHGNRELETGRAAPYDEDDIQLLKEDLEHKVRNPEKTKRRRELPEEVDDLEEEMDERISDIERATRVLLSRELRKDRERKEEKQGGKMRTSREEDRNKQRSKRERPSYLRQGREYFKSIKERTGKSMGLFWRASFSDLDLFGFFSSLRNAEP